MMVMWGSLKLWNSEGTATDIVKDSVVATYVLELDGMFYSAAMPALRAGYEAFGGMAVAPGRGKGFNVGQWVCWVLDIWFMLEVWVSPMCLGVAGFDNLAFLSLATQGDAAFNTFIAVRLAIFGLSNGACVLESKEHTKGLCGLLGGGEKPAVKYAFLFLNFGSVFIFTPLFLAIMRGGLGKWVGYSSLQDIAPPGTALFDCINSPEAKVSCINLAV